MPTPLPVQQHERSDILDCLRGFALLGIFMANCAVFSMYVFLPQEQMKAMPTATPDLILTYIHFMLIDGKFYSIFSLLFGIGFSIIFIRNQQAGRNPLRIFYRRLLILALIGLAHTFINQIILMEKEVYQLNEKASRSLTGLESSLRLYIRELKGE